MKILKILIVLSLITVFISLTGCKPDENDVKNQDDTVKNQHNGQHNNQHFDFNYTFELNNQNKIKCGDDISFNFNIIDTIKIDTIVLFVNDTLQKKFTDNFEYTFATVGFGTGAQKISIKVYSNNKTKTIEKSVVLYSDIIPISKTYKVLNSFPHDREAYTQGLFFNDGVLYESTGLETRSSLRKIDVETGEIITSIIVPNNVFGEGITIFNDNIYLITWQDHIAYVVNKDDLSIKMEFNYNTEGWGITNDDTHLFMSDGTNKIYILDPSTFTVIDEIQVYDDQNKIMYLNELEMINGLLYANVYTFDFIVVIDPITGKVLEKIDMTGLLPNSLREPETDVLNGIAYDKDNNRIFVTGKNWPRLFEVEFE